MTPLEQLGKEITRDLWQEHLRQVMATFEWASHRHDRHGVAPIPQLELEAAAHDRRRDMNGTCKTCRYWGEAVEKDYMEFFTGGRVCIKTFEPRSEHWHLGLDHGRDEDVESGHVVTGPDYGCIHYESKLTPTHPKCPKCGAAFKSEGVHGGMEWECGSFETAWPAVFWPRCQEKPQ